MPSAKTPANQLKPLPGKMAFYILETDSPKLFRYLVFIQKCIDTKRKIPSTVINRFLNLFNQPLLAHTKYIAELKQEAKAIAERLKLSFSQKTKADVGWFVKAFRPGIKQTQDTIISFSDFIDRFFQRLKNMDEEDFLRLVTNKKTFIVDAYTFLYIYLKVLPIGKRPTSYQKKILIGAMGVPFGLFPAESDYKTSIKSLKYYSDFLAEKTSHLCNATDNKMRKKR